MNTLQYIIAALLKSMYYDFFQSGLSEEEERFIKNLQASKYFRNLFLKKTRDGKLYLVWPSEIGSLIACDVHDKRILFHSPDIYDKEKMRTIGPAYQHCVLLEKEILSQEIEEIKTLFMSYSIDAEPYFQ